MRRLLLLVTLLALPATAHADEFPPWFGCGKIGCYSVTFTQFDEGSVVHAVTPAGASTPYPDGYVGVGYLLEIYSPEGQLGFQSGGGYYWGDLLGFTNINPMGLMPYLDKGMVLTEFMARPGDRPIPVEFGRVSMHTTPEPATVILLGSGLAGLLAARRRRFQPGNDAI